MTERLAWHFLKDNWTTNERGLVVRIGKPLVHAGRVAPGYEGLHASMRLIDALSYANGSVVTRVRSSGNVVDEGGNKFASSERVVLWGYNAEIELRAFARQQALSVIDKWSVPVPEVVRQWLDAGDQQYQSAARSAVRSAARSAAYSAAESAARSAAESAAENAAYSAAENAAYSAAWSAARSVAQSAAWSAADSAADSAARSVAWSAAWSAAEDTLVQMISMGAEKRGFQP